jgi:hypothetical protein
MKTKNILEKSFRQKLISQSDSSDSSLIEVRPGTYMLLFNNEMKRIMKNTQGLELGTRVKGDNHKIVLVEEDVILVPCNG